MGMDSYYYPGSPNNNNTDKMGEMERKIIEFGNLAYNDSENVQKILKEIAQLELREGDDNPYKIMKKGAKGCHSKIKLRWHTLTFIKYL